MSKLFLDESLGNTGTLVVIDSIFSSNKASTGSDGGGAIYNLGTLTMHESTINGNLAEHGGGISNVGTLTMTASTISDNSAINSGFTCSAYITGGGIANSGKLNVQNSTIRGNYADCIGGAGIENDGTLTVNNSTFSDNSGGQAGGGIANSGKLNVRNSTFSGNWSFRGGAISNTSDFAMATITNSTFAGNFGNFGESIYKFGGTISIRNTIMVTTSYNGNCGGTIGDGGGNLRWPASDSSCVGTFGDPMLGPLTNNGGPTQTMALLPDSAAIDAAVNCPPPATDQRGVPRPQGVTCDIGAYEKK